MQVATRCNLAAVRGDYPNIDGGVVKGNVMNNDRIVYGDPDKNYLTMNKFTYKTKFMYFSNRQFVGES